jgi:hypothetical protein
MTKSKERIYVLGWISDITFCKGKNLDPFIDTKQTRRGFRNGIHHRYMNTIKTHEILEIFHFKG